MTSVPSDRVENSGKTKSSVPWITGVRYEHLVAGVGGGVVSTLILHPLDLLKIRFAVSTGNSEATRPSYAGIKNAVRSIVRSEGVRGLYAGISPNLVGAGSAWGFYFFFYNIAKSSLQDGNKNKQLSAGLHLMAASSAGVLTLTMTNPVWVVKTRLCLQGTDKNTVKYSGLIDAILKIGKTEGLRGLYSGFVPGLFGVSHGAIQFMTYEELKKSYHNYHKQPISTKLGTKEYLFFAALSKLIAAFTTYPYQVVRTRLQDRALSYSGSLDCITRTFSGEGIRGFYKGLVPNLLRVVPATMITFLFYENASHFLMARRNQGEEPAGGQPATATPIPTPVTGIMELSKKTP